MEDPQAEGEPQHTDIVAQKIAQLFSHERFLVGVDHVSVQLKQQTLHPRSQALAIAASLLSLELVRPSLVSLEPCRTDSGS